MSRVYMDNRRGPRIVGRLIQDECPGPPVNHIYQDVKGNRTFQFNIPDNHCGLIKVKAFPFSQFDSKTWLSLRIQTRLTMKQSLEELMNKHEFDQLS